MSVQDASTSADNAEIVRRGYEAFNKADIATLTELIDENASWHTPGRSPIAGDYLGRDAVFAQFGRYGGDTGGSFRADLQQVFTSDDGRVVGLHHNSGVRNGKQLDTGCCTSSRSRTAAWSPDGSTSSTSATGTSSGRSPAASRTGTLRATRPQVVMLARSASGLPDADGASRARTGDPWDVYRANLPRLPWLADL